MKTITDMFGKETLDFTLDDNYGQAELNIFDGQHGSLIEIAVQNIDSTKGFGNGYAERNPELLAGVIQAMIIDHNSRHLIHTLQRGLFCLVEELRRIHKAPGVGQ